MAVNLSEQVTSVGTKAVDPPESQVLEPERPDRKRDLEALQANPPRGLCFERLGVQAILGAPPTLKVPFLTLYYPA